MFAYEVPLFSQAAFWQGRVLSDKMHHDADALVAVAVDRVTLHKRFSKCGLGKSVFRGFLKHRLFPQLILKAPLEPLGPIV